MKEYKTAYEHRERMKAYYHANKERILEYKRQQREKELQHKSKRYSNLIEMYEDWNLYIIERLQSPKRLPKWMRRAMILQIQQNNDRINEIEQYGQNCNTR